MQMAAQFPKFIDILYITAEVKKMNEIAAVLLFQYRFLITMKIPIYQHPAIDVF